MRNGLSYRLLDNPLNPTLTVSAACDFGMFWAQIASFVSAYLSADTWVSLSRHCRGATKPSPGHGLAAGALVACWLHRASQRLHL